MNNVEVLNLRNPYWMADEDDIIDVPVEDRLPFVSQALAVQPVHRNLPTFLSRELVQRHQHVQTLAAQHHLPIQVIGCAPTFSEPRVYRGVGTDWAFMNLADDPSYYANGEQLIMPQRVINEINRMLAVSIDFDAVYIAHETPQGSIQPGQPIPLEAVMPPPPASLARRLQMADQVADTFWKVVGTSIVGLGAAAALVAGGVAAAPLALSSLASLDPILFGVLLDKNHRVGGEHIGLWYYLTHWTWDTEE